VPSQYRLLPEAPQRQNAVTLWCFVSVPSARFTVTFPETRSGPFGVTSTIRSETLA
jgi:hypothetical protein